MRKIFLLVTFSIFFSQLTIAQSEKGVVNIAKERKIALVIGNTNYDSSVGRLKNPVNDARDMAEALQRLGFTLVGGKAQLDVNKRQMLDLIREFGRQIKQGGVSFFYFSGHGVQVEKRNYIIPITDTLVYEDEAETEAVEVDTVAKEMEFAGNRLNILVLDACRNNELRKRTKDTLNGLAEPKRKPRGTIIAFAADDGQTASDNSQGRNGLFTGELLKNLETANARLDDIFRLTRNRVEGLSNGMQSPMIIDKTNDPIILRQLNGLTNNQIISETQFSNQTISNDFNLISFQDISGKYGFKNDKGLIIIKPRFDDAGNFIEGLAWVKRNEKFGFIDGFGKEVIEIRYDRVYSFYEGLANVIFNNKQGYINKKGEEIIPLIYDFVPMNFSDDFVPVRINNKYGYINKNGIEVIPFKFDSADLFNGNKAKVKLDGKEFYIDKNGNEIP